jgi:hypothetical protein
MSNLSALIGYSGFVGSNIASARFFDHLYNSKNINGILEHDFELVISAGIPALKWWANQNPDEDFNIINKIANLYKKISTKRFVLISTVDVYSNLIGVDENFQIDPFTLHAYGRNRLLLENSLKDCFEFFHVIRLPALYGDGIKKNIIFDLINNNQLNKINPNTAFQWYPLSRIVDDINSCIEFDVSILNAVTQPIFTKDILSRFFPSSIIGLPILNPTIYDVKTIHSNSIYKNHNGYILNSDYIINDMEIWLTNNGVSFG